VIDAVDQRQGCQISLAARCQNGENLTKWPQYIPNGHETYQKFAKYSKWP
jgi:hypothetical protein